jgi:preprotein translocase subunit YajC
MIIRPQNKRNAQISDMLSKLDKGSEVIAASGILGKVKDISGAYVSLEIGENNIIKLQKSSIANILPKGTIDAIK